MGREGNKSKLRTKENLSVKGGGVGVGGGGVRGRMWSARKSVMAEFQPLVLACSILYCHAQSTNFSKVLFIFLKRTDEPKKKIKKLIIRVLLINARQWYFGSKH